MSRLHWTIAVVLGLVAGCPAWAADATTPRDVHGGFSLHAGHFDANPNPSLTNGDAGGAWALAGSYQAARHFAVALDLHSYGQEFDSGIGGSYFLSTVDSRMNVDTTALSVQTLLTGGGPRFGIYGGVGLGLHRTELTVKGTWLGFPGEAVDESDTNLGVQALAGVGLGLSRRAWLDFQYRWSSATADFGHYSNGEIDVGGQFLFAGFRYVIRPAVYAVRERAS